jgi:hypothetical protein
VVPRVESRALDSNLHNLNTINFHLPQDSSSKVNYSLLTSVYLLEILN